MRPGGLDLRQGRAKEIFGHIAAGLALGVASADVDLQARGDRVADLAERRQGPHRRRALEVIVEIGRERAGDE